MNVNFTSCARVARRNSDVLALTSVIYKYTRNGRIFINGPAVKRSIFSVSTGSTVLNVQGYKGLVTLSSRFLWCTVIQTDLGSPIRTRITPKERTEQGRKTTKKSTLPAKRKPKTAESDEDFIVSEDEEEKHLEKTQKTKNTSRKRTSNSIDSSDEGITPAANKKAKRKNRCSISAYLIPYFFSL